MIDKLRKRMIWICGTALIAVFLIIFALICLIGTRQLNTTMDMLADRISEGGGVFLPFDKDNPRPPGMDRFPGFFTEETPFSTRFFVVRMDGEGNIVGENVDSMSSVSREDAWKYAVAALAKNQTRGWRDHYRYKISDTPWGKTVVFVDGSMNRATTRTMLLTAGSVLIVSMTVILLLIILLSRKAMQPMAESYEKQKQFVTDANHELKTPLTLILTNLDILEAEIGKNEWLDDIRTEGQRMSGLVNQLTALSRLDEGQPNLVKSDFLFSEMVKDTVSEFLPLVDSRGLRLSVSIQTGLHYVGDEGALRRVVAILLDNAVKYCDPAGTITVSVTARRHVTLTVENTCQNVERIPLSRLFDRFYRTDKARTAGSSFGIGLSLAQSIVRQHNGEISAYKVGTNGIGFKILLK